MTRWIDLRLTEDEARALMKLAEDGPDDMTADEQQDADCALQRLQVALA